MVASFDISISALRVTNDSTPFDLQKAQSKLSMGAGWSAKGNVFPRGCASFTVGPSHMGILIYAWFLPRRREMRVMLASGVQDRCQPIARR